MVFLRQISSRSFNQDSDTKLYNICAVGESEVNLTRENPQIRCGARLAKRHPFLVSSESPPFLILEPRVRHQSTSKVSLAVSTNKAVQIEGNFDYNYPSSNPLPPPLLPSPNTPTPSSPSVDNTTTYLPIPTQFYQILIDNPFPFQALQRLYCLEIINIVVDQIRNLTFTLTFHVSRLITPCTLSRSLSVLLYLTSTFQQQEKYESLFIMRISRFLPFLAIWPHSLGYSLFRAPSEKPTVEGEYVNPMCLYFLTIL